MNAIASIFSALGNLARALNRLAAVADAAAEQVEQRLPPPAPAELDAEPRARPRKVLASGNGRE